MDIDTHYTANPVHNPLQNFPQWERLRNDVKENTKDIDLWEELITLIEDHVSSNLTLVRSDVELKNIIHRDFDDLLTRFPYLTIYWKRYITIEYTLNGLKPSVIILERAVTAFPSSLELWLDYLNIVISNNLENEAIVKGLFQDALDNVGRQFLSHPLWDLYLEWESNVSGDKSNDYLNILLKLIRLPLHQYAKYSERFQEVMHHFTIEDLISEEELLTLVEKTDGVTSIHDLGADQQRQLSEGYFSAVFSATYEGVTARWEYESELTKQDFDLMPVTDQEMKVWLNYLDFEEQHGDTLQIISLYERALVPTCSYEKIWLRYLKFLIQNTDDSKKIVKQFNRACDIFISIDQPSVRYMFAQYYHLRLKNMEKAKIIYTSLISMLNTDTEPISKYFNFLIKILGEKVVLESSINVVKYFIQENFKPSAEPLNQKKRKLPNGAHPVVIKHDDFKKLYKVLNFRTVTQLVVEVAKYYWLSKQNVKAARDILISFFKEDLMRCSLPYWTFFFKFELSQRNKKNLTNVINYIKFYGQLPITSINDMIKLYVEFMFQNSAPDEIMKINREIMRYLLETDTESSMHMKHFLKSRLDPGLDEEVINKRLIKENGHPGATAEHRPKLITPIEWSTSLLTQEEAASIPSFRNVEKASVNVKYAQESI
ncbi:hypothetical protein CANARDRAFT_8715 [[Candida] arabinofermentans NRRL YB-2248]|uniref:Suppressor of forked domain-containing protein n=1 Tax=[Candida] arabinofermentans NRRL YB-2248 TaxID=983967 RepID=A0A1E4SY43_9ASCO|nr:hypothetical protein CANARDRAFT_8715 [[Candida] arabinofermentans NRRL YB-2248]